MDQAIETDEDQGVLSDNEATGLLEWALMSNPGGMLEDDLGLIWDWAHRARVDAALLSLVLERRVRVKVKDGEVVFWRAADE
jgi:hypothetical protein